MTNDKVGTLYLVATPIGNLEDMTFRAIRILKEADLVYCEDTRRTMTLLRHFKIEREKGLLSFHDHSKLKILQQIRRALLSGQSIAYLSDAGLPVVSDPGFVLVREALAINAPVTVIPGPTAASTIFALSGLASPKYFFHGFFPRTRGEIERVLEVIRENPVVHIFYEAPGRMASTVETIARNLPEAQLVLGRELTKLHEEILRGTAKDLVEALASRESLKGECVLAVLDKPESRKRLLELKNEDKIEEKNTESQDGEQTSTITLTQEQQEEITTLIQSGVSSKDAAKLLSKKFKVPRRVVYDFIIRHLT